MATVMNGRKVLSIKGGVKVIKEIENGNKKADMCWNWFCKYCDP
jgi:hypothetical protein